LSDVSPVTERLLAFLAASPTPFHAVAEAAAQLEAAGYRRFDLRDARRLAAPGERIYVASGGSLFAVRLGSAPLVDAGFRLIAAHTDSPNLRIKPQPLVRSQGYVRLGLEVYGGAQLATWADRDLGVAGIVHVRDSADPRGHSARLVDLRRPLCRIPTLAIHLNREVNAEGLKLNAQTQLPAVLCLDSGETDPLRALLAEALHALPTDILTWDLQLYDLQPPSLAGAKHEFIHSGRLDNLASSHAGLEAMLASLPEGAAEFWRE
jgi:aspartyl aminopeptidase